MWLQVCAVKNSNTGDISGKLRKFKAVCLYTKEQSVHNINLNAFSSFKEKLKPRITTPKEVSSEVMMQTETFDRMLLTKKEQLYLDLFLFSYYAGGMSTIDVCLLTRDFIKDSLIIYDRTKYDKQARVIIIDKAAEIIERYRTAAYMNYVFPTINQAMQSYPSKTIRTSKADKQEGQ